MVKTYKPEMYKGQRIIYLKRGNNYVTAVWNSPGGGFSTGGATKEEAAIKMRKLIDRNMR